ncbi:SSU ribosomal protein S9p (S16e) [Candidatus Vidania fulgoroideae]|nr:SSU ribosomal protein S9p (S16e) [Candidatus Vidania fulgoroideae]
MIGIYFFNKGKKKTSRAKVLIRKNNVFGIVINGKKINSFFKNKTALENILCPISIIGEKRIFIKVKVKGGGEISKSIAVRIGLSRCICNMFEEYKKIFKEEKLIKSDTRIVERKKVGFVKSRKRKQYSKR